MRKFTLIRLAVTTTAVVLAALAGWYLWHSYQDSPWTRDGRVRANVVNVAADVSGPVLTVRIRDNQEVKTGELLFTIDPARYQLALAQAQAALDGARSQALQRQDELQRKERLTSVSISEEALTQARSAAETARAALQQAEAAVGIARLNLERTEVHSPVNGHITNLLLEPGDYATTGRALVAIVDSDSYYVAGYFEETRLRHIAIGDAVAIHLMGYATPLRGHVHSIARAIADRDNVVNTDLVANVNPTFSWVRLAQRIPVRIAIDRIPDGIILSAGMTATVRVTD
ncbi:MAG: HlyD family secretion protein [Alphaproteobacteria bacterium]|nr:HlyD family secretion protein [Alphaproteobacteria bacterium]